MSISRKWVFKIFRNLFNLINNFDKLENFISIKMVKIKLKSFLTTKVKFPNFKFLKLKFTDFNNFKKTYLN